MSEGAVIPVVVLLGVITVLLVRSRDVSWWEAVIIGLFGVYVAQTPAVFTINGLVTWFLSGFNHT
ncbi:MULTISPECIES: hypothetical protein [Streptomyces]|uniref:Uncharacterized protein n=1 Tax=Streptomyces griseocarneus TaxID=51201 RepID=A0ABX7RL74_9ACTN|nr:MULTISPECIES: hypothetical protein [Streptomyces]QSY48119.1 hypothetical protein J3S04_23360 [Streptomyces griseocarneus]